jgi:hypothetical protein
MLSPQPNYNSLRTISAKQAAVIGITQNADAVTQHFITKYTKPVYQKSIRELKRMKAWAIPKLLQASQST